MEQKDKEMEIRRDNIRTLEDKYRRPKNLTKWNFKSGQRRLRGIDHQQQFKKIS